MRGSLIVKRLALVPIGVLLGLLVLELGLQGAAWIVQKRARSELPTSWVTGHLRILCLGDSNTYGVVVPRDKTWPKQLETLWNESGRSPRIEVLNLGFPGTNSSRVVRDFPRLLEILRPDLTLIMIGVNDFWTVPFPLEDSRDRAGPWDLVKRHSRIHRLYYLISRGKAADDLEVAMDPDATLEGGRHRARVAGQEFEMGFSKASEGMRGDRRALREHLRTLSEQARRGGTQLYFMTYPARFKQYSRTNPPIRDVAAQTGTPLIDLTEVFEPLCPEQTCPEYLLRDDHHPNERGYRVVAETIAARLSTLAP